MEDVYEVFTDMMVKHIDSVRSGEMHRGQFISMYLQECRSIDHDEDDMWLKYPQFVSKESSDHKNNWLTYALELPDDEYEEFKRGINARSGE